VNAEEVDTVTASAVEVNDVVVVVVEDTHLDKEMNEDDEQSHRPTISEERVATVAAIAIEVADAVIMFENTHYDKANGNEGDCFWNYDDDDEVLDVDDVNGRDDDDDEDREAVLEQPFGQQPTPNAVPNDGGNPCIKAYLTKAPFSFAHTGFCVSFSEPLLFSKIRHVFFIFQSEKCLAFLIYFCISLQI
jgi:hypothetical protein